MGYCANSTQALGTPAGLEEKLSEHITYKLCLALRSGEFLISSALGSEVAHKGPDLSRREKQN